MKVIHIAETITGGPATVLRALTQEQVALLGADSVTCLVPASQAGELYDFDGVVLKYTRSGRNISSLITLSLAIVRAVRRGRYDIVHLHSTFAGIFGRIILFLMRPIHRPKVVYCAHGWSFNMQRACFERRVYRVIERWCASITDAIICVSRFEYETAIAAGIPKHKLNIIYNEMERVFYSDFEQNIKSQNGDRKHIEVLFIGRFDYQKGFDILLNAIRTVDSDRIKLTAIGDHVNGDLKLKRLRNVKFTGWLRREAIARLLVNTDVVVVPSRWEAFGLAAIEAMACSKPVIAANVGGLPELVEDGVTGFLFEPGDISRLAAILSETPQELWARMGAAARQAVESRFERGKCARETNELYRSLRSRSGDAGELDATVLAAE